MGRQSAPPRRATERDRDRQAEISADRARRAHEARARDHDTRTGGERSRDASAEVDAHTELTRPEHSKARPLPRSGGSSGGGNDGP